MPAVATKGPTMSRKPKLVPFKLPENVADRARVVAAMKKAPLAEMVGDILDPILIEMERRLVAERAQALPAEASPPARKGRA